MADDLRDRMAQALIARIKQSVLVDDPFGPGRIGQSFAATEYDLADAALTVRDDELADLRREVAYVTETGEKWRRLWEQVNRERSNALVRAEHAEDAVARVRTLACDWATLPAGTYARAGRHIIAALDVPADGEQTPTDPTEETPDA